MEGLDHVEAERAIMDGQWKGASWWVKDVITEGLQESCFSKLIRTVSKHVYWSVRGRVLCLRGVLTGTLFSRVLHETQESALQEGVFMEPFTLVSLWLQEQAASIDRRDDRRYRTLILA